MDSVGENNNEEFMREGTRRIKRAERRSLILCLGLEITTYNICICALEFSFK